MTTPSASAQVQGSGSFLPLSWAEARDRAAASGRLVRFLLDGIPWEVTPQGLSNPGRVYQGLCPRCDRERWFSAWAGEELCRDSSYGLGFLAHDGCRSGREDPP